MKRYERYFLNTEFWGWKAGQDIVSWAVATTAWRRISLFVYRKLAAWYNAMPTNRIMSNKIYVTLRP